VREGVTDASARVLRMSYVVASVAGVAFFVMSVVLLGIWPGRVLEEQTRVMMPEHPLILSVSEERGREIYSREGCAYCHTQQIRHVHADVIRFGAPTLAWETRLDYPHLWGTRRIGPDLAREAGTHSDDWHFAHLYAPRAVVPDSVMPAYAALFDGSPDRPTQAGRDLVAYLETLGRAREVAGPEGEARARAACNCVDDAMAAMGFAAPALNASPSRTRPRGGAPPLPAAAAETVRGTQLYIANCAGCHGARGQGDGPGAVGLHPKPANLAEHTYARARLADVLWNGMAGTSMQAWRDHPVADLAAIADVVDSFGPSRAVFPPASAPAPDLAPDRAPALATPPANLLDVGARIYAANCVQCHGLGGDGRGTAAGELRIAPTDFRAQRLSLASSLAVLRDGIEGTQMAPWTGRVTDEERLAVAHYVRSLFQDDRSAVAVAAIAAAASAGVTAGVRPR
jgi:cytochrome c oxidase cbb3-type subunit II